MFVLNQRAALAMNYFILVKMSRALNAGEKEHNGHEVLF